MDVCYYIKIGAHPAGRNDRDQSLFPFALVLAAGLPVLAATWALLSPPVILSSEMTWDLLFNLAGAWHLWFGHVPHVDYHEPVGVLTFLLTEAGFRLLGPSPRAVLAGMAIFAAVLFAVASLVAARRLTLLPAALFVVFVCLIVLRPANVGDHPDAYSFAMAYNRYGWSAMAVLGLLLFEPPRHRSAADIIEMACAALLLAALFYLKMTYFAAGVATLAVALVASPHVRERWRGWGVVMPAALALIALPFNWPYLADLIAAARAGIVRDDAAFFFNDFAENAGEYAAWFAAAGLAAWLWRRQLAPLRLAVAAAFLPAMGLMLLSQNSQAHGVPLAVVAAFLFHAQLQRLQAPAALALAVLAFPLASIVSSATSLVSYHARLGEGYLRIVETTNLKRPRRADGAGRPARRRRRRPRPRAPVRPRARRPSALRAFAVRIRRDADGCGRAPAAERPGERSTSPCSTRSIRCPSCSASNRRAAATCGRAPARRRPRRRTISPTSTAC